MATDSNGKKPAGSEGAPAAGASSEAAALAPITLSDGREATVRKAKGRDLEKGAAVAQNPTNPMSLMMGVLGQVTAIDGTPVPYEDILDLPMFDIMMLIGALAGKGLGLSQLSAISS